MIRSIFNDRNLNTVEIAVSSILANKMRATLTALGIIFGVAAIITMLAIGKGAEAEILEQLKATGVNNIMINAKDVVKKEADETAETTTEKKPVQETKNYSKGLNLEDAASISQYISTIDAISTEAHFDTRIISAGRKKEVKLIGINDAYASLNAITIAKGSLFNSQQNEKGLAVCIIGSDIKKYFFTTQDAVGNYIKCGTQWLKIVGVTAEKATNKSAQDAFGIHNPNTDIYVPIQTLLIRFQNPAQIKPEKNQGEGGRFIIIGGGVAESQQSRNSIHQVKRITVKVKSSGDLEATAALITKLLKRRHNNVQDFEVVVPELLLKQQQKTKEIFSLVLSVIAGISLLVGGIGIMNIMLASVLERTKEIGTRMAIGAQKLDIVKQFLFEAILISLSGGIIGILLGVFGAVIIAKIANIPTIISTISIVISFVVSTGVGIIFGYSPAKKAAQQNPIESLRYE